MATEAASSFGGRPRPWLFVLLGVVIAAYVATQMFSGGPASPPVTSPASSQAGGAASAKPVVVDPAELDVRIETLTVRGAESADVERNPFRFQPKPAPPPPPMPPPPPPSSYAPPAPTGPPPPPPIGNTIRFIGIVETGTSRIGAFSDCKATFPGREGEVLEGKYRIVRIGVESATLVYLDGTGQATLPLNGQACVK